MMSQLPDQNKIGATTANADPQYQVYSKSIQYLRDKHIYGQDPAKAKKNYANYVKDDRHRTSVRLNTMTTVTTQRSVMWTWSTHAQALTYSGMLI
jgi:hypothetical protein